MTEEHDLMTVKEVAQALRISPVTVHRMIKAGKLTAIRPGKAYRIHRTSFRAFKADHTDVAA